MISIKNLYFSYSRNNNFILNNININIPKNSYVSILGKNGSCKSTLLKLIAGLIKPSKGIIKNNSNTMGYVPQRGENFNPNFPITIHELLKCHMKSLKINNESLIDTYLNYVDMLDFKESLIGNLSGGQQQKIFIAKSLIGNPNLLLLDEPSTGIDTISQKQIYSIIKNLQTKYNMTVISIEHNLKAALFNSSHIICLEDKNATIYDINEYKKLVQKQQLA